MPADGFTVLSCYPHCPQVQDSTAADSLNLSATKHKSELSDLKNEMVRVIIHVHSFFCEDLLSLSS